MRLFWFALALGFGEGAAALVPTAAGCWPAILVLAALAALWGYGHALRGWPVAVAFLLGATLFLHASVARERQLRDTPWLRNARSRVRALPPSAVRRELGRRATLGLDPRRETVALNRAILLGERHRIPSATQRVFRDSGTMHVFAISGLHVMVVAKTLAVLLALLFVPLRWAGLAALPVLWGYVHLIGMTPSAVRAALMASLYFAAPALWRRSDALRAWSLTFVLMHVWNPFCIVDLGSLLSFAVMLALVWGGRIARSFASESVRTLFLTVVAWAAGTPIAAYAFGRVTPGGLVANLVLISTAAYSVAAGAVGVVASCLSTRLATYVNNLAALFTDTMTAVAQIVARLPAANFEGARWTLSECVLWYLVLIAALMAVGRWVSNAQGSRL